MYKVISTLLSLVKSQNFEVPCKTSGPWEVQYGWVRTVHLFSLSCVISSSSQEQATQKNGHDCGLWVVATAFAHMHGNVMPDLQDKDMALFRRAIFTLANDLPAP